MSLFDWLFVKLNGPKPKGKSARQRRASKRHRAADGSPAIPASERDRRRVDRYAGLGARVIIDKQEHDVADWSQNSFRLIGYRGDLVERQIVHFRFLLVYREETWGWPGVGRVVRLDEKMGEVAVLFQPPEEPFRTRLRHVTEALEERKKLERLADKVKGGPGRT
jgi:hypothetical protein